MVTATALGSASASTSVAENRTFRRLLRISSISMLGSHVTAIAYPLLILRLTGSAFDAGCAVFATTAPSMFAYIPAGALVDRWSLRWSPRRLMMLSEFGRGLAIGAVAATLAFGKPMVPILMVMAVIEGVLEVFSGLAERRYVGSIVERDQVSSALVRIEARAHVVLVAGRPLGGLLFGLGPIFPFLVDATSFIYSVAALFRIKDRKLTSAEIEHRRDLPARRSLIVDIRQGLRWIHADTFARMVIISFAVGTLIFQALIIVFLGEAHSRQLSVLAIGTVLAASGIGGIFGSAVAMRLLPCVGYFWMLIQTGIWFAGFAFLVFPVGRQFFFMAITMAILGLTGAVGNIALDTHLMQSADQEILARVTSVSRLASFAACAVGPMVGGVLVQEFGVQLAMFFLFLFTPIPFLLSAFTLPASRRQVNPGQENPSTEQDESRSGSPDLSGLGPASAEPSAVERGCGDSGETPVTVPIMDGQRRAVAGSRRSELELRPWSPDRDGQVEQLTGRSWPGGRGLRLLPVSFARAAPARANCTRPGTTAAKPANREVRVGATGTARAVTSPSEFAVKLFRPRSQ